MRKLMSVISSALLLASPLHNAIAQETFRRPITASVVVTKPTNGIQASLAPAKTQVMLMNINLTRAQKRQLMLSRPQSTTAIELASGIPTRVDLGMNGVPVLNQGMHGACVTFAVTAAIDALLGKGDYISQLCSLELGSYLEKRSYLPSGWDGSYGDAVLSRIREFGIVNKDKQQAKLCAGVDKYPLRDMESTGTPMSLDDFAAQSEDINSKIYWYSILTPYERFDWNPYSNADADRLLKRIKNVLATKNSMNASARVTFAAILPVNHCSAGACGKYHKTDDTWALTSAIVNDNNIEFGGHEMVITGYDDNAIAIDHEEHRHKGLLILRNSWGDASGDNGDYYMTYDFFKQFVWEAAIVANEEVEY